MEIMKLLIAYIVLGATSSARTIVDNAAMTLEKFLSADPLLHSGEGYMSIFTFASDIHGHHAKNQMLPDFQCQTHADWLYIDIDRGNSKEKLTRALKDIQVLVTCLIDDLGIDSRDIIAFFSGGKGFHLAIRTSIWNPTPHLYFHLQCGLCAEFIAKKAGIIIDIFYDRMRILRLPNTRHPFSGLFKSPMTVEQLMSWGIDTILERAKAPRAFTIPSDEGRKSAFMEKLWSKCVEMSEQKAAEVASLKAGPAKVYQKSFDFIINGASAGTRNDSLFATTANLADFPDKESLIIGLVYDAAHRSGLSDAEITRTINSALKKGK